MTVKPVILEKDAQQRDKKLVREFNAKFSTLSNVASIQAQTKHDATLFDTLCTNVRNDMQTLNI